MFSIFEPSGLKAFHGNADFKSRTLELVAWHEAQDKIIQDEKMADYFLCLISETGHHTSSQ